MKYISPGGWFSLEYPQTWREFEDTEDSFLFYDPNQWSGNFRISAYKDRAQNYAQQCIDYELKTVSGSCPVKVGEWECAYSAETFQEGGAWYTSHVWVTGKKDLSFECTFTTCKGGDKGVAEQMIASLEARETGKKYPQEIIPVRIAEISQINTAFEWATATIKKELTKDFVAQEADIEKMQEVMDNGRFELQQRAAWENFGLAFGVIVENEMDGMEWVAVVDNGNEYPALQFAHSNYVINPAALVWEKIKQKQPCRLNAEFRQIKREAEAVIDDLSGNE